MSPLYPKDQASTDALEPSADASPLGLPDLDDLPGPAAPLPIDAQQAMVQAAIASAFPLPPSPTPASATSSMSNSLGASPPSTTGSISRLARRGFLAGGAVALLGAGAALWSRSRRLERSRAVSIPDSPAPSPPSVSPSVPATASPGDSSLGPHAVDAAPRPSVAATEAATGPAHPSPRASETSSSPRASADRKATDASDLLQRASERRRQGRFADAAAIYQQVLNRYPGSDAAYVARVSAGMLYVDRLGDPARARALFQGALKQQARGALHEEARLGLADAWRALGDSRQERAALQDFLRHHPQALARPQAERRLHALEAR